MEINQSKVSEDSLPATALPDRFKGFNLSLFITNTPVLNCLLRSYCYAPYDSITSTGSKGLISACCIKAPPVYLLAKLGGFFVSANLNYLMVL